MLNNTKNKEHGNLYPNPRQRLHELTASKKINVFIKNIGKQVLGIIFSDM